MKAKALYEALKSNCVEGFTREWSARTDKFREIMGNVVSEYEKATAAELPGDVDAYLVDVETRAKEFGLYYRQYAKTLGVVKSFADRVCSFAETDVPKLLGIIRKHQQNHAFTMREWTHDAKRANAAEAERDELRERLTKLETCIVCGASLLPSNAPPHCDDSCQVSEEHQADWEMFCRTGKAECVTTISDLRSRLTTLESAVHDALNLLGPEYFDDGKPLETLGRLVNIKGEANG